VGVILHYRGEIMANKKVRLTPLQVEYKKEIDRLMRGVKKAEKQGYIFDEEALPKMPKRVTKKSLTEIRQTKPSQLKEKAHKVEQEPAPELLPADRQPIRTEDGYLIDPNTGEVIEQPEVKTEPKKENPRERWYREHGYVYDPSTRKWEKARQELPRFTSMVISNFREDVSHFPEVAEPMISAWLGELINNYGEDDVAQMLEEAKGEGVWIDYTIAYKRDALIGMISQMMEYLPDASDQFKKDLTERFEYGEDWSEPD
jgi:hypothetical protein